MFILVVMFCVRIWLEFTLLVAGLLFDFLSVWFRVVSLDLGCLLFCWDVLVLSLVFVDCNVWGLFFGCVGGWLVVFVLVCMVDFDGIVSLWYCVITRLLCLDVCRCWVWICLSDVLLCC